MECSWSGGRAEKEKAPSQMSRTLCSCLDTLCPSTPNTMKLSYDRTEAKNKQTKKNPLASPDHRCATQTKQNTSIDLRKLEILRTWNICCRKPQAVSRGTPKERPGRSNSLCRAAPALWTTYLTTTCLRC